MTIHFFFEIFLIALRMILQSYDLNEMRTLRDIFVTRTTDQIKNYDKNILK